MTKYFPLLLVFCILLIGCKARPSDIPREATRHWDLKSDYTWTWTRDLEHGCVAWMAKDAWADLQIVVGSPCRGDRQNGYLDGKGLTYVSVDDFIVFKEYWPWSSEIHHDLMIFDDTGMIESVEPCPYTLSQEQIIAIQLVVAEALQSSKTNGEKRMLTRLNERLMKTDGHALEASQFGCADKPLVRDESGRMITTDAWTLNHTP